MSIVRARNAAQNPVATATGLSLTAVLGFKRLSPELRETLHTEQLRAIERLLLFRTVFGVLGIVLVVAIYHPLAPSWLLIGWAAAALLSMTMSVRFRWNRARHAPHEHSSRLVKLFHIELMVQAAVWSAPMLVLAPYGGPYDVATLWTLSACLMAAVVIAFHPMALLATAYLLIVGGSSVWMMVNAGSTLLAIIVAIFSVVVISACMRQAQIFGRQITLDSELADNRETVSMLLREFDASGGDWLWQTDPARRITGATPNFARAMRIDAATIEGKAMVEVLAGPAWQTGQCDPALHELANKLRDRSAFASLILPVEIEGMRRWWQLSGSPRMDERGVFLGFRGVASDVTVEQEANARIAQLARFDLLTKLPNRLHLTEALGEAVEAMTRRGTRCALLMIDLDRFKGVNDTLGHQVGDQLLALVAERLRLVCTDNEVCGRLGGDEFAVVFRDTPSADYVDRVAGTIIERVSQPYVVDNNTLFIGASIGSATAPRDGRAPDTLIRNADLALYRAKDEGGGRHVRFIPALHADAEERRVMEAALRSAIANNEFHLEYQPVVDAVTGELNSFEALLRWVNPELGQVPPLKFIPLAEEARLITLIGDWVLRTACREAANWPKHIGLAVNMSAEQLYDVEIMGRLASAIASTGFDPRRLELEVTESVFMREGSDVTATLERILALGIKLSLDDFGTGYSSLGYLTRSRFQTIKIDRSFVVRAANGEPECIAIMKAVVALSRSLGIGTTAEGVETEEQHEVVRQLGCTKVQGFYFGRPMKIEAVHQLFRDLSLQAA